MEAPEKVYLLFNRPYLVDYAKLNKRRCEEEVEYTRTETFIEKACLWLKEHALEYASELNCGVGKTQPDYYTKHFIEDFKKYMEE